MSEQEKQEHEKDHGASLGSDALASPAITGAHPTWRLIDTAPKNGSRLLLHPGGQGYSVVGRRSLSNGWWESLPGKYAISPTHWMPLPDPPAEIGRVPPATKAQGAEPRLKDAACEGADPILRLGSMSGVDAHECRQCGMCVRWDLADHRVFGFKATCFRALNDDFERRHGSGNPSSDAKPADATRRSEAK